MKLNQTHSQTPISERNDHLPGVEKSGSNQTVYCLLLTACIDPNLINEEKNIVARIDPRVRLDDYKRALIFWNEYDAPIKSIVFVENSGADLTEIYELVKGFNKKVEIIQFKGCSIPKGVHYG